MRCKKRSGSVEAGRFRVSEPSHEAGFYGQPFREPRKAPGMRVAPFFERKLQCWGQGRGVTFDAPLRRANPLAALKEAKPAPKTDIHPYCLG